MKAIAIAKETLVLAMITVLMKAIDIARESDQHR